MFFRNWISVWIAAETVVSYKLTTDQWMSRDAPSTCLLDMCWRFLKLETVFLSLFWYFMLKIYLFGLLATVLGISERECFTFDFHRRMFICCTIGDSFFLKFIILFLIWSISLIFPPHLWQFFSTSLPNKRTKGKEKLIWI